MLNPPVKYRSLLAPLLAVWLVVPTVLAQQQKPPRPESTIVKQPLVSARAERPLVHADAFKSEVFKGAALTDAQKETLLTNLSSVGLSQQTAPTTMQQYFGPVPPAQATGMACVINYAGTAAELSALRKTVAGLIEKNKATDLPKFEQGIPKNCPYKELYFYLDLLAQLTKE